MRLVAAVLMSGLVFGTSAVARDLTPAEQREISYSASLPGCADPSVLSDIASAFARKESRFWNSSAGIAHFEKVKDVAWRPWGYDMIPRRFCTAVAAMSDGYLHRVDYSVREDLGFAGVPWSVEWCVVGYDRNKAYSPACRAARP